MDRRDELLTLFRKVRQASLDMCAPLSPEDYQVQPSEEVSPPKWNLGHTSWFFWRFILRERGMSSPVDDAYAYLLNSYYHRAGLRNLRGRRGVMTRPTVQEIYQYRKSVDDRMELLISTASAETLKELDFLLTVGKNHEQQHQELFYTEIKNIYYANVTSLRPAYIPRAQRVRAADAGDMKFVDFQGGTFEFGNTEGGWCWDNELQTHKAFLGDFALSDRLITNREFLQFMDDGGYSNSLFWLSDGWFEVERQEWRAPLYWEKLDGKWWIFTLSGMRELDPEEPVCHVSFYEACAFANWKSEVDGDFRGCRLPTEREWEQAARVSDAGSLPGNFVEEGRLHPTSAVSGSRAPLAQMLGDVWEWTSSHYEPYPGFRELPDDLSEYNGKFMNNQRVLRGGSCATPRDHIRLSYRNFWHPATRFQFTGIRLAKDLR
jgi:ergothioneine biosynthesis protein EgtB